MIYPFTFHCLRTHLQCLSDLERTQIWLKNRCFRTVVLEKTLASPLDSKEIKQVNLKGNQPRIFIGRTDAEAETPTTWPPDADSRLTGKETWCWERLKAEGEEGDRGWGGWMASPIQWTWTWANSERWWGTRKPGVLQSMGLQRVGHDLATERQQELENWLGQRRPV